MKAVPKEKLKRWHKLLDHGDNIKICEEKKLSPPTVSNAIKNGKASRITIILIDEYFDEVEKSTAKKS